MNGLHASFIFSLTLSVAFFFLLHIFLFCIFYEFTKKKFIVFKILQNYTYVGREQS
jgi:hypothetical protein